MLYLRARSFTHQVQFLVKLKVKEGYMFPYSYPPPLLVEILMGFLLVLLILMLQNLSPARLDHYCRRNFQRSVANTGIYHVSLITYHWRLFT
jgi:glycerol uptake facilitator-like aquaporin